MAKRHLQAGATGSFNWAVPADTNFAWRYGYYTDTDGPDGWAKQLPGSNWGSREVELLRESMKAANKPIEES